MSQSQHSLGERAADRLAILVGSWRFVIAQNIFVLLWITLNAVAIFGFRADPYPFILLNLLFSWQASNTGPILQLSQNRQAAKDRERDDLEAREVSQVVQMVRDMEQVITQVARLEDALLRMEEQHNQQLALLLGKGSQQDASQSPSPRGLSAQTAATTSSSHPSPAA